MRIRPLIAVLAALSLALSACSSTGTTRNEQRPSVSPEEVTPIPSPENGPEISVVDSSPGGPKDADPLWQGLAQGAAEGKDVYLKVWVHVATDVAESGQVTLTPDTPNSVSVTVDAAQVSGDKKPFYLIHGTFKPEANGDSAFTLTTVNTDDVPDLDPRSPDDQARCTAEDGNDRIMLAAQDLSKNPDQREQMRQQWGGSPAVWWGIQRTADSLASSSEDTAGDFLTEACEPYLQ